MESLSASNAVLVAVAIHFISVPVLLAARETDWFVVKRTSAEQGKDVESVEKALPKFKALREKNSKLVPDKELVHYEAINWGDKRAEPLCRIGIVAKGSPFAFCSCSFVDKNLVATAAHCIVKPGITGKSDHALFVQQQFDKDGKAFGEYPVNIVTEWWYPVCAKDAPTKSNEDNLIYCDVAFLHTKNAGTAAYKMMPVNDAIATTPTGEGHRTLNTAGLLLGYPFDFQKNEKAAFMRGNYAWTNTKSRSGKFYIESHRKPSDTKKFAVMGEGGSGGPFILAKDDLKPYKADSADEELKTRRQMFWRPREMAQFGVVKGDLGSALVGEDTLISPFDQPLIDAVKHIVTKGLDDVASAKDLDNGEKQVKLKVLKSK